MDYEDDTDESPNMQLMKITFHHCLTYRDIHEDIAERVFDIARAEELVINRVGQLRERMRNESDPRNYSDEMLQLLNVEIPQFLQKAHDRVGEHEPEVYKDAIEFSKHATEMISRLFADYNYFDRVKIHKPTSKRNEWWIESEKYGFH